MQVVYRKPRNKKTTAESLPTHLKLTHNATGTFEIYDDLRIYAPSPISQIVDSMMHFYVMKDTVAVPLSMEFKAHDNSNMVFGFSYNWTPNTDYRLDIDSAAWTDIYGLQTNATTLKWKTRPLEDYANMVIKITPYDSLAVLQLLSPKDEVVKQSPAQPEGTKFENIRPGDYYIRLFIDTNQDQKWTSGDYELKRQAEKVIYSPKKMTLRANWDFEEEWNTEEFPVLKQKPKELQQAKGNKKR
jgi:hypothetical protein